VRHPKLLLLLVLILLPLCLLGAQTTDTGSVGSSDGTDALPWWGWATMLFFFTILVGVVAVIAGVGGGVLFVPIVSAFFPFHFDYVRGTGLLVILCGALAAGPRLIRHGLSDLKLAIPMALFGSIGSIIGAWIGLTLPASRVEGMLGFAIIGIVLLMLFSPRSESLVATRPDQIARLLGIGGTFSDGGNPAENGQQRIQWTIHRTPLGMALFVLIGVLAGMFGLGAGWANVPALHLLLGAPIKVAVATSGLIVAINDTAAAWVYLNGGAVLPVITVPSVAGMMIGTRIGARLLPKIRTTAVRWIVIATLLAAGIRALVSGFIGGGA